MATVHPSRSANVPPSDSPRPSKRPKHKHPRPPPPAASLDLSSSTFNNPASKIPRTGPLRNSIRNLERLLSHTNPEKPLPANVRVDKERELAAYKHDLAEAIAARRTKEMVGRYHMVRFFDRRKATRALRKAQAGLKSAANGAEGSQEELISESKEKVRVAEVDLNYALYCPLGEKYISLYPSSEGERGRRKGMQENDVADRHDKDIETMEVVQPCGEDERVQEEKVAQGKGRSNRDTKNATSRRDNDPEAEKPPLWPLIERAMAEGKLQEVRDGTYRGLEAFYGRREDRLEEWLQESSRKRKRLSVGGAKIRKKSTESATATKQNPGITKSQDAAAAAATGTAAADGEANSEEKKIKSDRTLLNRPDRNKQHKSQGPAAPSGKSNRKSRRRRSERHAADAEEEAVAEDTQKKKKKNEKDDADADDAISDGGFFEE